MAKSKDESSPSNENPASSNPVCGIVMPISAIDGLSEKHWTDVKLILEEAIEEAGYTPNLVSNSNEVGVIQKNIVRNLYENPMVVVDVSAKNPNVMFELGLRLAFDKPTVIVKDNETNYAFDVSPIEHIGYPRTLRFADIVDFKEKVAKKIRATQEAAKDPKYSAFVKHFGSYEIAQVESKSLPEKEYLEKMFKQVVEGLDRLNSRPVPEASPLAELVAQTKPTMGIQRIWQFYIETPLSPGELRELLHTTVAPHMVYRVIPRTRKPNSFVADIVRAGTPISPPDLHARIVGGLPAGSVCRYMGALQRQIALP